MIILHDLISSCHDDTKHHFAWSSDHFTWPYLQLSWWHKTSLCKILSSDHFTWTHLQLSWWHKTSLYKALFAAIMILHIVSLNPISGCHGNTQHHLTRSHLQMQPSSLTATRMLPSLEMAVCRMAVLHFWWVSLVNLERKRESSGENGCFASSWTCRPCVIDSNISFNWWWLWWRFSCKNFRRRSDESVSTCSFFFFFFKAQVSSRIPILLVRPGSVHSGSVNWDDCGQAFTDDLCVRSYPW